MSNELYGEIVWTVVEKGMIGELPHEAVRACLEDIYVIVRHKYVSLSNSLIDLWNQEAEALGIEPSSDLDSQYNKFMREKMNCALNVICSDFFQTWNNDWGTKLTFYIGEELDMNMLVEFLITSDVYELTLIIREG